MGGRPTGNGDFSVTNIYDVRDLSAKIRDFPGPSLAIPEAGGSALLVPVADTGREAPTSTRSSSSSSVS